MGENPLEAKTVDIQAKTLDTKLNVFETFRPKIPDAYRSPDVLFLGNIDPDLQLGVLNQIEGGMIQSASMALKERIDFDKVGVTPRNWDDYPILRFSDVPPVEIELINTKDPRPFGIGDIGLSVWNGLNWLLVGTSGPGKDLHKVEDAFRDPGRHLAPVGCAASPLCTLQESDEPLVRSGRRHAGGPVPTGRAHRDA